MYIYYVDSSICVVFFFFFFFFSKRCYLLKSNKKLNKYLTNITSRSFY